MIEKILKLDIAGRPTAWITREEGALLYCRDQVAWEAGTRAFVLRGGFNRVTGLRTVLRLNTIVATKTVDQAAETTRPVLTNAQLFARDAFMCLYCGEVLPPRLLTRDHVIPVSRGGRDEWENVVTACRACNHRKDDHLLDEIGMRLLAVPFVPNRAEGLILQNRTILSDQMEFLKTHIGRSSRLLS